MSQPSAMTLWHIAVLIPARNEERLLPRCLNSVLRAASMLPGYVTTDIVVVADCCTDTTEPLALDMLQGVGTSIGSSEGNVGMARALAACAALARVPQPLERCWLANTDADCDVPDTWLLQQLQLAQEGWAAVTGIVDVDCFIEHHPAVETRFRMSYELRADGTHPHVHGANLGVRADAYLQAGGWGAQPTAEDHDLWNRLRQLPVACCSDSRLKVLTSGRRVGRAPLGFAGALAKHNLAVPDTVDNAVQEEAVA